MSRWPYEFSVGDLMRRAHETPSEQAKRERLAALALWRDLHREVIPSLGIIAGEISGSLDRGGEPRVT